MKITHLDAMSVFTIKLCRYWTYCTYL